MCVRLCAHDVAAARCSLLSLHSRYAQKIRVVVCWLPSYSNIIVIARAHRSVSLARSSRTHIRAYDCMFVCVRSSRRVCVCVFTSSRQSCRVANDAHRALVIISVCVSVGVFVSISARLLVLFPRSVYFGYVCASFVRHAYIYIARLCMCVVCIVWLFVVVCCGSIRLHGVGL